MLDIGKVSYAQQVFGVETTRPHLYYTNDSGAASVKVGDRMVIEGATMTVRARPMEVGAIKPAHWEILLTENDDDL